MKSTWAVKPVSRSDVSHFIEAHYLGKWPGVVVLILGLFDGDTPIGCIVFSLPPRETYTRYGVPLVWELGRLFIIDDTPKNAETWFISRSIAYIRKFRRDVKCLVSYADPSVGHQGTIYQAGNWIDDGRTDQGRKTPRFDYVHPTTGKHYSRKSHVPEGVIPVRKPRVSKRRYVYWLDGTHEKRRQSCITKISNAI
jgi:hypothetical protein